MTRLVYKNKAWDAKISEVMDRYVISNKYPKDNPKVVRTILWRTLCNASKFSEGQQFVRSNTAQILLAAIETLQSNKQDASVINACVMTVNNLLFVGQLDFAEVPKEETYKSLVENLSSENENTVIAILNCLCRLVSKDAGFRDFIKKSFLGEFTAKLSALKYHKAKTVQFLVEDVQLLLAQ